MMRGNCKHFLRLAGGWSALSTALLSSVAWAQILPGSGSADRPRPEYDPIGLHFGGFYLYPELGLQANYLDNIYASSTHKQGDAVFHVRPAVSLKSSWSRNSLSAGAYVDRQIMGKYTSENGTEYGGSLVGRYDISSRTWFNLSATADKVTEDRSNVDTNHASARPIHYTQARVQGELKQTLNRWNFNLQGAAQQYKFSDGLSNTGAVIDQHYRDRRDLTGSLRATYLFSPGYRFLFLASANDRRYDRRPGSSGFNPAFDIDRASHGYRAEAGIDFELTNLLYGNIRAGYLKQSYRNPGLKDVSGISAGADLLWNITTLTSLRLTADRRVEDTSSNLIAGRLVTETTLGIDHELLRNLIITLEGRKAWLDYQGIDLTDKESSAGLKVKYLMNRSMTLQFDYVYEKRSSIAASQAYNANGVGLTLNLAL